ncbi:hypothetical protein PMZ80_002824 [Knufia obscura]|uniref:Uncharacterized protein n=2 Tax=Knufia TaxID=430999 RepID=A0AAN8E9G9_9EURO|nr:hypothetical protein PMZ80_002824 [Knufia obscura]KAK5948415.1 hypothetical protein OHC33_010589 [Knufia fluminis]
MTRQLPHQVDTVIVGSGPSALILSYILHGNIPLYDLGSPHPDPILHNKLKNHIDLLTANVDHLTEHFYGSRFSYSTQALPVNVLLDTLIRPYGETDEAQRKTCVKWQYDPSRAVPHVVVGKNVHTGGQWADNPVKASWDIGALSYAGMLSLPGYSFEEYYYSVHGEHAPFYLRPTRRDVAGYLARYPDMVGIQDAIFPNESLSGISRHGDGFYIASHGLLCKHLVLASGTFTSLVPPRPLLQPLMELRPPTPAASKEPLLVVGSGFSAADVILSAPSDQKIVHIYKWAPSTNPSPLRACHQDSYPEYAGVYRKMKLAALASKKAKAEGRRPSNQRKPSQIDLSRDWNTSYEGLPNTAIVDVESHGDNAVVTLQTGDKPPFQRTVGSFAYVVGRRGSLDYLNQQLRQEVCHHVAQWSNVTGATLRERVSEDLEVTPGVFVTGSLTGDSLIRFGYGACAYAAGRIMAQQVQQVQQVQPEECSFTWKVPACNGRSYPPAMNGLQGHEVRFFPEHRLPLDRRKSEICVEGS